MTIDQIHHHIKKSGSRLTTTRKHLVLLLHQNTSPLSVPDLLLSFAQSSKQTHKTTLYRDLELFERLGLVTLIDLGDGTKRYELVSTDHHHHLVCDNCHTVIDVSLPNDLSTEERHIEATHQFIINRHSLEFFGLCQNCQQIGV